MEISGQYGLLSLETIEQHCWVKMLNGSLSYKDVFHNPVVANRNNDGVNMRTVVLRKADAFKKKLFFHTDTRSGKWTELQADPHISWLFYNPAERMQIRAAGMAVLHCNDVMADEAWLKSTMSSRKIYIGENSPSSIAGRPVSGLPQKFETADPTPEESEAGRKNFGIVATNIQWMEWLWLNSAGHRRAAFHYHDDNSFTANWLVP